MQRSTPLTRNTGPASCARNFDGTVSRCFASSVCSKLPLKAKAHVQPMGGSRVDPRWRSGRSPATPTGCSSGKLPHNVPLCNTIVVIRPTNLERRPFADMFSLQRRGSCGGVG